ncbi:bifunctional metallophosphatase/5'-nucleotidase [Nocardioides sp. T2.26MG-1]|uniref:bifunctional metallophosphatase/5'-nucleotidase n=1 Tax=Nocardioides sp. T2.26MG-1 TaxID=3041166 RepID=UPI00247782E8|nr:bifunctional UDP-sugar hydrolase/5'-nucleotidase [Nocardioides sp. T2.26MG-1]CAI9419167.1 hypothetical protein HIDPHFAB_03556 [Nocardioides sp. T2.26MG-1]
MPTSSTRARRGIRALTATAGLALVATSTTLVSPAAHAADPVDIQILGINDFHGRVEQSLSKYDLFGGAGELAGAVNQLRGEHPDTVFAAAGDLIGASTFTSFIAQDKPTIDALNAAGLEVSAVGNHEFDKGYDDLLNRVMAPYNADTNPYGGAQWQYISANVKVKATGNPAVPESWIKDFGDVQVGFVGAVTEHLGELVSPAGIADLEVTDIVAAANKTADDLKADGADIVVLLVHEGASGTDCATMDDDPASDFGSIITGVDDNVDAIISGHTHLAYNCKFPVAGWSGRALTERPVVSAGQYGMNLNQLVFSLDPTTQDVLGVEQNLLPLVTNKDGVIAPVYPTDAGVQKIVDDAVGQAEVLGAKPLGEIAAPFKLARLADGTTVNRGGESTQGNMVAEVQRWATSSPEAGSAQLAVMNPGGLRQDLLGLNENGYPATLTYKQAATAQPFANTLVNMDMTGAQIKTMLEQQWQPEGSSRPFLKLGTSDGFTYTYEPAAPAGEHVQQMWLNGEPIRPAVTYSVTANSFLSSGGDNFAVFKEAATHSDTGKTDLQAMVDYLDTFASETPLEPSYQQHAVGVSYPSGTSVYRSRTVSFGLSSLAFSNASDVKDDTVSVSLGEVQLGEFPVDSTVPDGQFDETGVAQVQVTLPASVQPGDHTLTVTGATTGTTVAVPVTFKKAFSSVSATAKPTKAVVGKTRPTISVQVTSGGAAAHGKVVIRTGGNAYTATLKNGAAVVKLKPYGKVGRKSVTVRYLGNDSIMRSSTTLSITVVKK